MSHEASQIVDVDIAVHLHGKGREAASDTIDGLALEVGKRESAGELNLSLDLAMILVRAL